MKVCTFASGSSGNCTIVFHGDTYILIDAGISARRIGCSLKKLGLFPEKLAGIFITHSHSDHIAALKNAPSMWGVPVFTAFGECEPMSVLCPEAGPYINGFQPGDTLDIGSLWVTSFKTPHDTPESVGYTVTCGNRKLAFATDMGYLTNTVVNAVLGADTAIVESNHDLSMLKCGKYPQYLKRRILGPGGHLSNDDCGVLSTVLAESGTQNIILAHLSHENNTPEAAYKTVSEFLKARNYIPEENINLYVAPRSGMGTIIDV